MSSRLPPSVYGVGTLRVMDCSACAVYCALQQHQQLSHPVVPPAVARFTADAVSASFLYGGAGDALIPLPLLRALPSASVLSRDPRVVSLVSARDIPPLSAAGSLPRRLCFCVPSGPLAARLHFSAESGGAAVARALAALRSAGGRCEWTAWLRSALSCRFEGRAVPPARVAEATARLIAEGESGGEGESGAAPRVVWEEGAAALNTPRALEAAAKTAAACGVHPRHVALAIAADNGAARRMDAAAEMGFAGFAAATVRAPAFQKADALVGVDDVQTYVAGINDTEDAAEEARDCAECCDALRVRWDALVAGGALTQT